MLAHGPRAGGVRAMPSSIVAGSGRARCRGPQAAGVSPADAPENPPSPGQTCGPGRGPRHRGDGGNPGSCPAKRVRKRRMRLASFGSAEGMRFSSAAIATVSRTVSKSPARKPRSRSRKESCPRRAPLPVSSGSRVPPAASSVLTLRPAAGRVLAVGRSGPCCGSPRVRVPGPVPGMAILRDDTLASTTPTCPGRIRSWPQGVWLNPPSARPAGPLSAPR